VRNQSEKHPRSFEDNDEGGVGTEALGQEALDLGDVLGPDFDLVGQRDDPGRDDRPRQLRSERFPSFFFELAERPLGVPRRHGEGLDVLWREQLHLALEGGELGILVTGEADVEDRTMFVVELIAGVGVGSMTGHPMFERVCRAFE